MPNLWWFQNVSTAEVAGAISSVENIEDVCVYGVEVPGADGKCGMAALQLGDDSEAKLAQTWAALDKELKNNLPSYARPIFYRYLLLLVV